jgi:hypothetical protein
MVIYALLGSSRVLSVSSTTTLPRPPAREGGTGYSCIPEGPLVDDTIGHPSGHRLPSDDRITAGAIHGGLHHEDRLEPKAA